MAVVSPYLRAVRTAELALDGTGIPASVDERLRDRELGVLDGLTAHGVTRRHPEEAQRRTRLGKFYYRPPGGESWTDVALRLRALLGDLRRDHEGAGCCCSATTRWSSCCATWWRGSPRRS
ncbi:histidine phosphatase family protein [Micromonospora sp. BRA006-A]|nr:histidine phosphatase family protein [Micromonospora sp. BRA006-A]